MVALFNETIAWGGGGVGVGYFRQQALANHWSFFHAKSQSLGKPIRIAIFNDAKLSQGRNSFLTLIFTVGR